MVIRKSFHFKSPVAAVTPPATTVESCIFKTEMLEYSKAPLVTLSLTIPRNTAFCACKLIPINKKPNSSTWPFRKFILFNFLLLFNEDNRVDTIIRFYTAHSFFIGLKSNWLACSSFLNRSFLGSHFNGRFSSNAILPILQTVALL